MEDLSAKLTQLLSDPDGMKQIQTMAQGLFGDNGPDLSSLLNKPEPELQAPNFTGMMDGISPEQIGTMMKLFNAFNSTKDDDRTRLLTALRPHLSDKRRTRLDHAVKLLKLTSVLPLISESGIFKQLGG